MSEAHTMHRHAADDRAAQAGRAPRQERPSDPQAVRDPVCGMSVDPARSRHSQEHRGVTYHFCSAGCAEKFGHDPARYLSPPNETGKAPANSEAIYTCPMHPEIRQKGPGSCPICGMALEPAMVTGDEGPSAEYRDMRRRFWVGVVLSVPLVVIAMGRHVLPGLAHAIPAAALSWVELAPGLAGRAVGRSALLRARLAVDREPQPQYRRTLRPCFVDRHRPACLGSVCAPASSWPSSGRIGSVARCGSGSATGPVRSARP